MSTLMRQLEMKLGERRKPAPYTGPDKSSKNGNRPLTFPTPYHGGKRRWADEILRAFGPEREAVYVEPFSGSAAVLLANERPYAREILCDTNPHIVNVFRSLAWAPEVVAFWADWPTIHQDLTSRHTWLLRWAVENATEIETNPDFYDPKAAGWWLWGKSNWIGSEFGVVKGLQHQPTAHDGMPHVGKGVGGPTAQGVQAQRTTLPTAPPDSIPSVGLGAGGSTGKGVQAQASAPDFPHAAPPDCRPAVTDGMRGSGVSTMRETPLPYAPQPPDKRPQVGRPQGGQSGQGVQANRVNVPFADKIPTDKMPLIEPKMGGQGVQTQRYDAGLPAAPDKRPRIAHGAGGSTGTGVQPQRADDGLPVAPDKRPAVYHQWGGGSGVSAQRDDAGLPEQLPPDKRPQVGRSEYGQGVSAQRTELPPHRDDIPYAPEHGGGRGVNAQRKQVYPDSGGRDAAQPEQLPPDKIPHIAQNGGGLGITAQREGIASDGPPDASYGARGAIGRARQARQAAPANDKVPNLNASTGVQAQRHDDTLPQLPPTDKMPHISDQVGGKGVQTQRQHPTQPPDKRPAIPGHGPIGIQAHSRELELEQRLPSLPAAPIPLTGDRLKPWFLAIAQRLYRVIILNRGWQSGLTPTVLQQTRTARKPPVRVLLDPPYKGVGKLYGMSEQEADALAVASWRWAAENGSRPTWRIAYACREGDFDDEALALGWTCSKQSIAANHRDSTQEVIWFSPYCER